ncbi:MAG: DUF4179 domain-containing protein [Lachnospiraceae bacterium]|nr:DUF4179 domain-containing protein [Lachnospiraceae bacterium]
MNHKFDFSKEFGRIDERLIEDAGNPWTVKRNHILGLYSRSLVRAAVIILICIAAAGNSHVQAAVKSFTTKIGEKFGFVKDLSPYTDIIDQTQVVNGISLTLKEVIIDDRVLMVSVEMDSAQGKGAPGLWVNEEKTLINGRHHRSYGSINSGGINYDTLEAEPDRVLVQTYEDQILPEGEVSVHLVLEAGRDVPLPGQELDCAAEFVYDFIITPEELKAQTVSRKLDITVAASGEGRQDLTLKELVMNDLYCRIIATGATWKDEWVNQYDLKLKGTDSFGNPVSLDGAGFLSEHEMRFVTDFFGDYEAGEVVDPEDFHLSVPDKNCTYLDLQLYERRIVWNYDDEEVPNEDEEYDVETDDGWEIYSKEDNYGWEPVGEPFRITISQPGV